MQGGGQEIARAVHSLRVDEERDEANSYVFFPKEAMNTKRWTRCAWGRQRGQTAQVYSLRRK
jgi:hypothetical protein